MICFDSEYLHVELYEEPNVLVTQWYGKCTSDQYREALIRFNSLVRLYDVHFAIADRRLLPALSKEDLIWTVKEFLPLFCNLPLKRFAVLNSFDEIAEELLPHFLKNTNYPIPFESQAFDDLTSAYDWLTSVKAE